VCAFDRESFRQAAAAIITNAHRINQGKMPDPPRSRAAYSISSMRRIPRRAYARSWLIVRNESETLGLIRDATSRCFVCPMKKNRGGRAQLLISRCRTR